MDDSKSTAEDTTFTFSVLGNDTDPDGDTLKVTKFSPVAGTLVLNPDSTFTYTPPANFSGTETFLYTIEDPSKASDSATVTITVGAVNDAPVAKDGSNTTAEDKAVSGTLVATDVEGDTLDLCTR